MIRFGTPVFNKDKMIKGVLILNFLGQSFLEDLEEATSSYPGIFSLLNLGRILAVQ